MILGLLKIFFPLFLEILILNALQSRGVNLNSTQFCLECLIYELVNLIFVHGASLLIRCNDFICPLTERVIRQPQQKQVIFGLGMAVIGKGAKIGPSR
jgi:hypothetical protein